MQSNRYSISHVVLALAAIVAVTLMSILGKMQADTAVLVIMAATGIGSSGIATAKAMDTTQAEISSHTSASTHGVGPTDGSA